MDLLEWTFKKLKMIWSTYTDHIISRLSSTNFTWFIREYFVSYMTDISSFCHSVSDK